MVPDVVAWETVISLDKASVGNRVRLVRLYSLMQAVGVTPSKLIFDSLLANMARQNAASVKINRKFSGAGVSNVSVSLYDINGHSNAKDTVLTVESIIQRMVACRVAPTTKTFNYLFLVIARSVDAVQDHAWLLQKCRDTYETMTKTHKLQPDKMTVGLMVKVHLRIDLRSLPVHMECSAEYMDAVFNLLLNHSNKYFIDTELAVGSKAEETTNNNENSIDRRLDGELLDMANGLILLWRRSEERNIAGRKLRELQRLVNSST